eukprot:4523029-Amphidinium_carterae.1
MPVQVGMVLDILSFDCSLYTGSLVCLALPDYDWVAAHRSCSGWDASDSSVQRETFGGCSAVHLRVRSGRTTNSDV